MHPSVDPTRRGAAPHPAPGTGEGAPSRHDGASLRLWTDIPPELAENLRILAGPMVREVVHEIQQTIPEGEFRDALIDTLRTAIQLSLGRTRDHRARDVDWKAVFRKAGRAEFLAGRTTDPLQTAIRVGARVVWRHLGSNGRSIGIPTETLVTVAETILAWVDELSAAAVEGYHEAQAEARARAADAHEQLRQRLARALLSSGPPAEEWVQALAKAADWPLPDKLVAIAVECRGDDDRLRDIAVHQEVLLSLVGPPCVLLPDPGGSQGLVADLVGGRRAAVGPAVAPFHADRSFTLATRMLGLLQTNVVPATGIAWCKDHLATLLLIADPFLTAQLREYVEDAFAGLTPKQRDRMATTLLVWLQTRGTHNDIAARLDVHPQTVRYRIHQLQQFFGDKLADPDARLTMELALRAHMLLERQPQGEDGRRDRPDR